jgi:CBS domain-containing protein
LNTWDIKEMAALRDRSDKLLQYYLENEISIDFVAKIMSEINDILINRAIVIAVKKWQKEYPEESKVKFSFLSLGSEGREEQLLRTDLDNAIVFEDVIPDDLPKVQEYMLLVGQEVIEILLVCGFHSCPADMMASNPKWCQPLSRWKKYFTTWITNPDSESLLSASIFFDFRNVYGPSFFAEEMIQHIYEQIEGKQIFLNFLAKNAYMNPAPLGFFRDFVVEKSGEHRDKFDIKLRAMMPLVDISRLLVLAHRIVGVNNTFKRFEKLAEVEPQNRQLYEEAGEAYEILMRMRALEGLRSASSGRFIDPSSLGKIQRQLLRNAFEPINDLHKVIRTRFQLDYFS